MNICDFACDTAFVILSSCTLPPSDFTSCKDGEGATEKTVGAKDLVYIQHGISSGPVLDLATSAFSEKVGIHQIRH